MGWAEAKEIVSHNTSNRPQRPRKNTCPAAYLETVDTIDRIDTSVTLSPCGATSTLVAVQTRGTGKAVDSAST
jgi:hypothetical protein